MSRGQKFKAEETVVKLYVAEVELAQGKKVLQTCKKFKEMQ